MQQAGHKQHIAVLCGSGSGTSLLLTALLDIMSANLKCKQTAHKTYVLLKQLPLFKLGISVR